MDKTLENKICDGQSVQHLFLSQYFWYTRYRHHVTMYTYGGPYYLSYVTNLKQMLICSVAMKIYDSNNLVNEKFGLK